MTALDQIPVIVAELRDGFRAGVVATSSRAKHSCDDCARC